MQDSDLKANQARDTGLAMVLISLIVLFFMFDKSPFILISMVLLVLVMTIPGFFTWLAPLWFGLAHLLGKVASTLLFSLLFFSLATPIGILMRLIGKDSMGLKKWKKDGATAFVTRDHKYSPGDLANPY